MEFREYAGWMVAMAIVKIVPVGDEVPTTGSPDGQRSVNVFATEGWECRDALLGLVARQLRSPSSSRRFVILSGLPRKVGLTKLA